MAVPGVTTVTKTTTIATAVTADAAADYTSSEGMTTVAGEKPISTALIEASGALLGGKTVNTIIDGARTAISKDIQSGTYSTLTKTEKATLQQTSNVVNSTGTNAGVGFAVGLGTEAGKHVAENMTVGSGGTFIPIPQVAPADATRVVRPYLFLIK